MARSGFLSWIAPRGIVAVPASALAALKLEALDHGEVELLLPLVFLVGITTVVIQSLISVKMPKIVEQRATNTNWESLRLAHMDNIPTYYGNLMSEHAALNVGLSL